MPVTTPVMLPTVAMVVALVLQVPPDVASLKVVDEPVHTEVIPVTGSTLQVHR